MCCFPLDLVFPALSRLTTLCFNLALATESPWRRVPHCCISGADSPFLFLLSEVTGESRPYHGKEAVDPRPGRARGSDPKHFHAVNVAQPVRFSSKLQTCPIQDLRLVALCGP